MIMYTFALIVPALHTFRCSKRLSKNEWLNPYQIRFPNFEPGNEE